MKAPYGKISYKVSSPNIYKSNILPRYCFKLEAIYIYGRQFGTNKGFPLQRFTFFKVIINHITAGGLKKITNRMYCIKEIIHKSSLHFL